MSASEGFREEVRDLTCERTPAVMVAETARLRLRQWRNADLDAYHELTSDAGVMQYINDGQPLDRNETWRKITYYVGHWAMRGYGPYAVELKETGEFIGRVGLYNPEGWPGLEVGWMISPRHQGQGYASEAAQFCLFYAFEGMGAERVISVIHPENAASIRVAEKLGAVHEGDDQIGPYPVRIYRYGREA